MSSLARASLLASESGRLSSVSLAIGDCSPLRTLNVAGLADLTESLRAAGIERLHYDFFGANLGSAAGHNRLLPSFDTDLILIVNPDIVASPYLIEELLLRLGDPMIGLVEGRQLPIEHPKYYDPTSGETSWATTACALLPRQVVNEVGDFDNESFFLYCDDVDYSWRIRLAGYKVVFHPPARVFHDKRLDAFGHMQSGAAEEYYAAEAALILAHKWSRPDMVKRYLTLLKTGGSSLQREAATAFEVRRSRNQLPEPVDPDHKIGDFDDFGRWTKHRWD